MVAAIRRLFALPLRSVVFDLCAVGLIALFALLVLFSGHPVAAVIGFAMVVPLAVRRRFPVPVFAVVCVIGLVQVLVVHRVWPYDAAVLLAMYTVVKYADRMLWAWVAAGAVAAGCLLYGAAGTDVIGTSVQRGVSLAVMAAPFWLVGLVMRTRRLYVRSLEARAVTAERERDQRARLAVAEERGRIARELHDVVAHSLAVMIVQADGASYALDDDPEAARGAVRTVARTGREALDDMRRLVAVLRAPTAIDAPTPDLAATGSTAEDLAVSGSAAGDLVVGGAVADAGDGAARRRRVGIGLLDELRDRFAASGIDVTVVRTGAVRDLPGSVELAGYRIVQEALTNVLKHAGRGTAATVTASYGADVVALEVVDDGAGRARIAGEPLPGGHGLLGVRERVAVFGGDFAAGPTVAGGRAGWRVAATIPLPRLDHAADTVDATSEGDA
ncbi:MAG TPA: histidine kinase [Actinocatenispora sp.]